MSRRTAQPRPDHQHAAGQARQIPGQWVLAGTYGSSASAASTATQVRTGERLPAYLPGGSFEAEVRLTQDGADVWVRFPAPSPQDRAAADFRESVDAGLTEDFGTFSRRMDAANTTARRA